MTEIKFKFDRLAVVALWGGLFIIAILPTLFILSDMITWRTGRTFVKWGSWEALLIIESILVAAILFFAWGTIRVLSLRFTEEGIRQIFISGWRFIAWKDITHTRTDANGRLYLYKGKDKVIIPSLRVCSNREEIADFIRHHVQIGVE